MSEGPVNIGVQWRLATFGISRTSDAPPRKLFRLRQALVAAETEAECGADLVGAG